jgi:hypothetical protein
MAKRTFEIEVEAFLDEEGVGVVTYLDDDGDGTITTINWNDVMEITLCEAEDSIELAKVANKLESLVKQIRSHITSY